MALNFIQKKFEKITKKINSSRILTKDNIQEVLKEIRISLIDADVNLKVVNKFIKDIENEAVGKVADFERTQSQELLKIINKELIKMLGSKPYTWKKNPLSIIMLVGLQGSGKTTTASKLAHILKTNEGYKNPLLVSIDIYRPAAYDQLKQLANDNNIDFFGIKNEKNIKKILKGANDIASKGENDLVIFDTAGRLQTDEKLMQELISIKKIVKPTEIVFVADVMAGQEIVNVASEFNNNLKLTNTIFTKLDSDARGGSMLSVTSLLEIPLMYIGVGEKITDFEKFYPDRIASRILGLGDIKTLTEKAKENINENSQEKLMRRIISGKFDLNDLIFSMESLNKIGSFSSVAKLIPGLKVSNNQTSTIEKNMKFFKILVSSMTNSEKRNPKLLKHPKRKERIIGGSGRTPQEYNELIRSFERMQKQMKSMSKVLKMGKMPDFSGGNPFGGAF